MEAERLLELLWFTSTRPSRTEREFVLLNRTREVLPYHAAVLSRRGELCHSGVSQVDRQGPYGLWLGRLVDGLGGQPSGSWSLDELLRRMGLPQEGWWPPNLLWLRLDHEPGGVVICRSVPWSTAEVEGLARWLSLWCKIDAAIEGVSSRKLIDWSVLWRNRNAPINKSRRWVLWSVAASLLTLVMCLPVRLTVRAPGEIVAREPTVIRSAIDGMTRRLLVGPHELVRAGQLLAELDDVAYAIRLEAARQALVAAQAEWQQLSQAALADNRAKQQLPAALGRVEERRAELAYASEQHERTAIRATHDGVVLVDDPGSWGGRTIRAGEILMKLAQPDDQAVQAWLSVGDAVDLRLGARMRLFPAARPAQPVEAELVSYAYEAQPRNDGVFAYRLQGRLSGPVVERLGARGTVHVEGERVALAYWILRRPLAALREATGI